MANADSNIKNDQKLRKLSRTSQPSKSISMSPTTSSKLPPPIPAKSSKENSPTSPTAYPFTVSTPTIAATSPRMDTNPFTPNLNRYPSFTIRCSSIDQQETQINGEEFVDAGGGYNRCDDSGGGGGEVIIGGTNPFPSSPFHPSALPATLTQYNYDNEVKCTKAISISSSTSAHQLIPSIVSSSTSSLSLTTKCENLDQQQKSIATKSINKCILVNPSPSSSTISSSSPSIITATSASALPHSPVQILDNKIPPPSTMAIPIPMTFHTSNSSNSLTKKSSSSSLDQQAAGLSISSPLSSSSPHKFYQVPPPPVTPSIHHPAVEHQSCFLTSQSLSTPSSLSSSKINLNDTTPSDFVPGIFLDNNNSSSSNLRQDFLGQINSSSIGGGVGGISCSLSPGDTTNTTNIEGGGIFSFDSSGGVGGGGGIFNTGTSSGSGNNICEAVQHFQSTNPFYNCDTKFKRDEFLKATMRICLVVSPPASKLQVCNTLIH